MTEQPYGRLLQWKRWDEVVSTAAMIVIVLSITWGVVSRYILPTPAAWTYELASLAFAWLVFFGAVTGVRLGTHAAIDVLVDALPMGFRRGVAWFNYLLLALLFVLLAVLFTKQAIASAGVHSVALNMSRAWYYGPLAIASAGLFVQHLLSDRPWRRETLERHADPII
ncbi:TRAP transporter small permease [Paracoccus sp. CPCC 101403]|uniref:TRAP transporter small permease protein n=2 Tax=Paracoccus broussonetiae TaxID=3075834 RepID=A0ABU3E9T2_9RHOB|nr:TRAP transporter small permease [Paracoccus sp. CPCC 101403]MDT1060978.1 TRAP transporter small permease [Paracoccus sp. CPCC 101403]